MNDHKVSIAPIQNSDVTRINETEKKKFKHIMKENAHLTSHYDGRFIFRFGCWMID